jgi:hypothetical protein
MRVDGLKQLATTLVAPDHEEEGVAVDEANARVAFALPMCFHAGVAK